MAKESGLTKSDSAKSLDAIIKTITNTLVSGDSVIIAGFGSFVVRERVARVGRNPQTGAKLQIKARSVPVFKAGKVLKDAVNEN